MTIANEISRLSTAKAALKTALEGKGVIVSPEARLDGYPALVDSITASAALPEKYTEYELDSLGRVARAEIVGYTEIRDRLCYMHDFLEQVTLPEELTYLGNYCFYACTRLASFNIPSQLATITANAFQSCIGLRGLVLPHTITNVGPSAFRGCTGLQSLWVQGNPTIMGNGVNDAAFGACSGLKSITLGSPGHPVALGRIGPLTFVNCTAVETMTVYTNGGGAITGPPYTATVGTLTYLPA